MSIATLIFFALAFVSVFFMRLFRMGTLLAFLLTGILAGQHVFGLFELSGTWNFLGELGIMFLWFNIGLQINMKRLWQLRRTIFGLGASQVLMVAVMLFPMLVGLAHWTLIGTIMISLILAMSSTSEDLQILIDRNQLQTNMGRQTFSILLFQDLLSIPLLAMLPVMTGKSINLGASIIDIFVMSLGLILGVLIVAKFVINPLMHVVAKIKSQEALVLSIMVNIAVWAVVLSIMGLPPALGAFLAGMLMSETVYRHQVTAAIEPYATLFLSFFFIVLGMGINLPFLMDHWDMVLVGVIGLVLIKFLALFMVARVRHVHGREAALMSLILAQGGEFGLLILQTMKTNGINAIPLEHQEILTAIIIVSIMSTPILLVIYDRLLKTGMFFGGKKTKNLSERIREEVPTVVICGFGRMGQIVAQMLSAEHISYVAIDGNVDEVILAREAGYNVIYGDSKKASILQAAGLKPRKTRAVVISLNDEVVAREIVHTLNTIAPHVKIFARAHSLKSSKELLSMGVKSATPEIIESSFILGGEVLSNIGLSKNKINELTEYLRTDGYENVGKPISTK
ncbi:MAG: cation:proton antiporter [Alphaproteobacteria bacterium]|nr:cation:proton antiporter [Alphaproteobacteria bacterium]